jgi:DNA-binding MarR family transcriptional regulator
MESKFSFFSPEYVTLVVEVNRLIDESLKESVGFSTTEYCILQQLFAYEDRALSTLFQDFLLLRQNSITAAITRLESRGLVKKEFNKQDYRTFYVQITPTGREVATRASEAITSILSKKTWQDPSDENIYWTMKLHANLGHKINLRIEREDLYRDHFIMPEWVVETKYLQQLWTMTVQSFVRISLSSYRLLALLSSSTEKLHPADISRALMVDRSPISTTLRQLVNLEFATSEPSDRDRRCFLVSITEKGRALEADIRAALIKATDKHFSPVPEDLTKPLNDWHMTMYHFLHDN